RAEQSAAHQKYGDESGDAEHAGDDHEFLRGPGKAGLGKAGGERDFLVLLTACLDFLQRALDLLAARTLRPVALPRYRLGLRDGSTALLGLFLAGQHWIQKYPRQPADRRGAQK